MCDIITGIMVGGAVLNAVGARKQGQAQKKQLEADAAIARENAALVDLQIKDAIFRGRNTERDIVRKGADVTGQQRVAAAANNLDLNFGSPLDLIYETRSLMGEDVSANERNTANEIVDLERQKLNLNAAASGASAAAKNAGTAGNLNALSALTGGVASAYKYRASIG